MRERINGNLALNFEPGINDNPTDSTTRQLGPLKRSTANIDTPTITSFRMNRLIDKIGPLKKSTTPLSSSAELKLNIVNRNLASPQRVELPDDFMDFDIDSILNSATISKAEDLVDVSEEKKVMGLYSEPVTAGNVRRSTILNADSSQEGVIYSFRQLQDYKQNNKVEFERAKQDIYMQARMAQDADGCGGRNEMGAGSEAAAINGSSKIINLAQRRMEKLLGKKEEHKHESEEDEHCDHGKHKKDCDTCKVA